MFKHLVSYGGTAAAFVALDALWLAFVGPRMYRPVRDVLLTGQVKILPAVLFYLIFTFAVVFLAVRPAARWQDALVAGAVVGMAGYGAYVFTNHAIMRNWTWTMTLADIAWGTVISGAAATAGFLAMRLAR